MMHRSNKIRVLVVDDSALMRQMITAMLERQPDMEVVGAAADPYAARDLIKALNPDVLTLDLEMPRMDGLTFLSNLMRLRPMPVVMVSSLTERGADVTLRALELGAVDYVPKANLGAAGQLDAFSETLVGKVRAAARARVGSGGGTGRREVPVGRVRQQMSAPAHRGSTEAATLVAIGASTGGTEAIRKLLAELPADAPAIVIAQHIPAAFSGPFAERLDRQVAMSVCEAGHGQEILPGHVYVAPGSHHLEVGRRKGRLSCRLSDKPPVNRHRPSVDVLFRSVAEVVGGSATGVLLTGMGADGAQGLLEMRAAGAPTCAQDEATSVVWGMPGEAVTLGAASVVLPLPEISAWIMAAAGTAQSNSIAKVASQ